jgi:PAS domain S-box-containing protein
MTSQAADRGTHTALLDSQRRVLERIASGAPLREILETLVILLEEQTGGMRCAVLLADPAQQRLRFAAAPKIPEDYKAGIDPFLRIAPNMGSCGTAAFLREPVYVKDTRNHPYWKDCSEIALRNGLRAVWSTPILSDDGNVLGTFAMYYSEPRLPSPENIQLIDMATQVARVAIEAKRAEEALRQSEDRLRLVIETIPAMVWTASPDGAVDFVNGRWLEYIGLSWEEFRVRGWASLIHPEDLPKSEEYWEATIASGQPAQIEHRVRRADGQYRWLLARGVPLRNELSQIVKWYGTATDIDNRKRAEETLRQSAKELQALSRRLVELQESERRELARELHDRIGQSLTALNINLNILETALSSQASDEVRARFADSAALIEATTAAIGNVVSELRPPLLDENGLVSGLDCYARQFSARTGIPVGVRGPEAGGRPAPGKEIALFRIVQEALNNVAKHAGASHVEITLKRSGTDYVMSVHDDGVGFDTAEEHAPRRPGLGLVTMRERAQAIGGRFEVRTLPGSGTRLTVRVPA